MSKTAYELRKRARQSAGITELRLSQPGEVRRAFRVVNAEAAAAAVEAADVEAIERARLEPGRRERLVVPRARPWWVARPAGLAGGAKAKRAARELAAEIALLAAGADPGAVVEAVDQALALARTPKS